jgi:hypothetical protein
MDWLMTEAGLREQLPNNSHNANKYVIHILIKPNGCCERYVENRSYFDNNRAADVKWLRIWEYLCSALWFPVPRLVTESARYEL